MRVRWSIVLYGLFMALAAALYLSGLASSFAVVMLGAGSAGAILFGLRRYRPRLTRSWLMLALAVALNALARVLYAALPGTPGTLKPAAWVVWLVHLAMLVLFVAGIGGLARWAVRGATALIDTAIIALGAGLLFGVLIAIPYASTPDIGQVWAGVRVGYVLRDVILVAVVVHLATAVRWTSSLALLVTGTAGLVGYDMLFRLGRMRGEYLAGTAIDLGWVWFYVALGAAALVSSMVAFDGPPVTTNGHQQPNGQTPRLRLGVVAAAALTPSAVLLISAFDPPRWFEPFIVITVTLILVLALVRILDVTAQLRGQVRGERVSREAIAELADTHDAATVTAVLDRTVGELLEPGTDYRVAVEQQPGRVPDGPPADVVDTAKLPPGLGSTLGGRDATLVLALVQNPPKIEVPVRSVHDGPSLSDDAPAWALLVRATRADVERIRPRLLVLARQAGLALERIRLNDEIIRHTSEAYFRTLVQNSADVILILDDANRIRYASPSATSVFGARPLDAVPLTHLLDSDDWSAAVRLLDRTRADAAGDGGIATLAGHDWTVRSEGGPLTQVEASCRDLRSDPSIEGLVLTLRNVTAQRDLERELAQRAFHDPLTGLSNRLPFSERLEAAVQTAAGTEQLAAVLFIDLDDLKMINDGFGHEVGDVILREVGDRLKGFVTEGTHSSLRMASRLGGDEFAILLSGIAGQDNVDAAAGRLMTILSRPVRIGDEEIVCAASVGVATTADADSAQDLLRNADIALYAAKGSGKRQWRRYEPWMSTTLIARLELRAALERAIAEDEFLLEYQPIMGLGDGRVVGFEALLRWQHPVRGLLPPDQFIDVAEESGLITAIGEWVFATGFRAACEWQAAAGREEPYIGVNVSARQFRSPGFLQVFRRLLAESGLPPERVMIEITESLLLREDDSVWADLQELRGSGVMVAIDDFGTGYSALSYLRQVPLDVVKLDRSFIKSISTSPKQRELVQGIVRLARILELEVIAEGIETRAECVAATQVGCDYGQGFLFSAPVPTDRIRQMLEH
jgi:diguanylate cyclase (GGDEF)-like protein/PAS domain S-box-containing protein